MKPLSYLPSSSAALVADTSAVINLIATECAETMLRALPYELLIVEAVRDELDEGHSRGRTDAELISRLVEASLIRVVALGEVGMRLFEELVVGSASQTLDDGEAATLAFAVESGAVAIIDERKATRICVTRFSKTVTVSSLDVLAHSAVENAIGQDGLADAIFAALCGARMRVPEPYLEWVVAMIGHDRACQCSSLPKRIRDQNTSVVAKPASSVTLDRRGRGEK